VCAVVVTYNRHDLLTECLDRIARQSRPPDHVLVVDNASTDGTAAMLDGRKGLEVLTLSENLGSSGGFARGLRRAGELGHDWIWLLDDDTFADEGCLEALIAGARRAPQPPSLVCSVVRWRDESLHPMNRPWLRVGRRAEFAEAAGAGLALIRTSTWVSTMVSREAVAEHGLPPAHFFIWLDDMEYTGRVLRDRPGYMVPESIAWHWTPKPYDTLTDARERFYYKARNHLWLLRGSSFRGLERAGYAAAFVQALLRYVRQSQSKSEALRTAARGIRDGLRRQPA
jgi:rhamnopyranosyl-N-acetylglucosaminyl-diphospho-decaprenol beta-1,3/1,4-galactofuranosyltransferase